jgi:hypothetical protein
VPSLCILVLSDATTNIGGEAMRESIRLWNENATPHQSTQPSTDCSFFDRLEPLEPGIVSVSLWRPNLGNIGTPVQLGNIDGVERKPSSNSAVTEARYRISLRRGWC